MISDQANVLFQYWPSKFEWFVVGGTADCLEAQVVQRQHPDVRCIGFEPNADYVHLQRNVLKFPGEVHPFALWSHRTPMQLKRPVGATPRSASVCLGANRPDMGGTVEIAESVQVEARTLDDLSEEFGPFHNAVLWIDIEGAEYHALLGATRLLKSGAIKLINLETYVHRDFVGINNMLTDFGFRLKKVWNIGTVAGRDAQDYIYQLEERP